MNNKSNSEKPLNWNWTISLIIITLVLAILINVFLVPDREVPDNLPRIVQDNITYINLSQNDLENNIQESINSGSFAEILWKIIYLGSGRDKLCFESFGGSPEFNVSVNNDFGEFYNLTNKKCFSIPKRKDKTTFNLKYHLMLTIPQIESGKIVDKSECLPETIDESINETCILDGVSYICHPCYTSPVRVEYGPLPEIKTYFEANLFHKFIKFLFVFIVTSMFIKELVETFDFFKKKEK